MAYQVTTNHDEVRAWAEQNKATPQVIDYPHAQGDKKGLRLDFPGKHDEAELSDTHPAHHVSWEEFFQLFDEMELAMEFADTTNAVEAINFYRFVKRDQLDS